MGVYTLKKAILYGRWVFWFIEIFVRVGFGAKNYINSAKILLL